MTKIIEATRVSKVMDGQTVLREVNFAVEPSSIHGLVGSNGAGKTTLLRLLNGVYQPSSGEIQVFGQTMSGDRVAIRDRIHLVSADGAFYPGFRVEDLLRYASLLYTKWDSTRANTLLKALELPRNQYIRKLSLGMKMQLRLAVALASHPDVLLLDEPTNGLDPVVRHQFLGLIVQEVAGTGLAVVFASHRIEELEAMADEISILHHGEIILSGQLEDFKANYHEVIVVTDESIADDAFEYPGIITVHTRGKIQSCIIKGDTADFQQRLFQAGALHVDEQPVDFEDLFRALMRKEGYSRDALLLS